MAQGVAMTMQGLRKMGSDSPESRRLINALLPYIEPDILLEGEGRLGRELHGCVHKLLLGNLHLL